MELKCFVQNYDWGERGIKSMVAKMAKSNMSIEIDDDKPYAEFWMGTHCSGPSVLKDSGIPLAQHLKENPHELGNLIVEYFGHKLPFLLKVLSVKKALSIQIHPSKSEAEELHKDMPHIYKDPNHKPEMAIALTEFKALCSFRPHEEIQFYLKNVPEFHQVIPEEKIKAYLNSPGNNENLMRDCFLSLMSCADNVVQFATGELVSRLSEENRNKKNEYHYELVKKLSREFPGDVGIFCIYWLNYIVLKPGEALYLAPNEPHAYLSGDCVECMSNSDNVVRAGLTPKLKDISTLCKMLSYKSYRCSEILFKPIRESEYSLLFAPPVNDFAIVQVMVPPNDEYTLPKRQSASILVITNGKGVTKNGRSLTQGSVFYLPSNDVFHLKGIKQITIFQAFCNIA